MALPEAALRCIDIAALSGAGAASLAGLNVSPEQEVMGRSFTDSLADWAGVPRALCRTDPLQAPAENAAARAVYAAYGMADSGPLEGPHGPEHRFAIALG